MRDFWTALDSSRYEINFSFIVVNVYLSGAHDPGRYLCHRARHVVHVQFPFLFYHQVKLFTIYILRHAPSLHSALLRTFSDLIVVKIHLTAQQLAALLQPQALPASGLDDPGLEDSLKKAGEIPSPNLC